MAGTQPKLPPEILALIANATLQDLWDHDPRHYEATGMALATSCRFLFDHLRDFHHATFDPSAKVRARGLISTYISDANQKLKPRLRSWKPGVSLTPVGEVRDRLDKLERMFKGEELEGDVK